MPRVTRTNATKTTSVTDQDANDVTNTPPSSPLKEDALQRLPAKPLPAPSSDPLAALPTAPAGTSNADAKGKSVDEVNANDASNKYGVDKPISNVEEEVSDNDTAAEELDLEEDGDGYLRDDSDEMFDPVVAADIASQTKVSLTLLVPVNRIAEVPRVKATIVALLDDCKEHLSPDVLQTTTYLKLQPTFLSRQRFGRLQVTFNSARDAEFVREQVIDHECVDDKFVKLTWQFPENARFLRERSINPSAVEVVLKSVPAEISPEMVRRTLVEAKVVRIRSLLMANPTAQRLYEELVKSEAAWKEYQARNKVRLQVLSGMTVELVSEAPTGYLSGLIKSKKEKTEIREVSVNGQNITGAREVLEAATAFFRDTFAGPLQVVTEEGWEVAESKRLRDKDKEALTRPWSEEEVRTALRELPTGKAPGQDGLPKELFEQNWGLLGKEVLKLVEDFEKDALLPEPFMTAVTILLHKKGAREQLGNYRPITLLSVLYKLVAKVLANRIKKVLPQVISERQYGFIPGRRLADAVSTVADVIDAAAEGDEDWLLLLVDFQKAYDSVSRDFLFATMEKMGFPGKFIAWTKGLHEGAGTKLMVNGWLGDRIGMEKGVRQGCPLAPYLFLCAAEPLCQEAERRGLGIRKRGVGGLTYVGYADDTTLALHGQEQVVAAKQLLDEFGLRSGLYINQEKTKLMPLGKNRRRQQPTGSPFQWAARNEPERLLGIWVTSGGSPEPSWYKAFERMCGELSKWDSKHLTTSARVTIVNSYAMPILLFQALVYAPPHEI
ncbi:unnamed protein product [Closterium sp. Yama58-4]|nr:unnamed protein product [Closterium sp. Yama58-4]